MTGPEVDVLVVGAGVAGLAAALEVAEAGGSVLVAASQPGSSGLAQGGIAAAVDPDDAPGLHASDTLAAGAGLCDVQAVRLLTSEAPGVVDWLTARGVSFDRDRDGRPALALEAAHSRPRVLHGGGDASGAAVLAPLEARLASLPPRLATRLDDARLDGLLVAPDGAVVGARLRHRAGELAIRAGAVVLATGGYAGLYVRATPPSACDGSALVSALAAGATLADLEFVQFHPTAYAGPGRTFLLTEALRGAGAIVTDRAGSRFLFDVDDRGELAPRAVVTRAIVERLRHSREACAFLDARPIGGPTLGREFPGFLARCRAAEIDPVRQRVPIAPAAHYTMGGIVTDTDGRTRVPGLLAAGECARTGVHGANRLASNSLLEAAVFGRRAGRAALVDAALRRSRRASVALLDGGPGDLGTDEIRLVLERSAGPLRAAGELHAGLRRLRTRRGASERSETNRRLAALVVEAALTRRESRGAHVRDDHPAAVADWESREVVVRYDGAAEPAIAVRPRIRPPALVAPR